MGAMIICNNIQECQSVYKIRGGGGGGGRGAEIRVYSGAPSLVDRVFAVHAESRGFDFHRRHMSERFCRSNRPGCPHSVRSEYPIGKRGIRVAVGDCSATERRRWRPPYQTGKTVHVNANTLQT